MSTATMPRIETVEGREMTAGPTGSEAPASVTVKLAYRGHDVMLTLRDADGRAVLSRLDAALDYLEDQGATPAGNQGQSGAQASACPECGGSMKESKYGGLFCPSKKADGSYCKGRIK